MRYIFEHIEQFSQGKLLLLSGPRQVGKSTLAKSWLADKSGVYLNWDVNLDRARIINQDFLEAAGPKAIIFDELHKNRRWKSYLKGLYDAHSSEFKSGELKALVTGSAKLDIFQRGGDSLLGRYEHLRLHPFTVGELTHQKLVPPPRDWLNPGKQRPDASVWDRLERMTGFPEPYTRNEIPFLNRWSARRRSLLVREDLRDISDVKLLSSVEELALLLPERVGSLLSHQSLSVDLRVAFETIRHWISLLEQLYFLFQVRPYSAKISRSIHKARKVYLWDWSEVADPAVRFENMVASHLLKSVHAWSDVGLGEYDLLFWRNKDQAEVDFVVTLKRKPVALFECKMSDSKPSSELLKLSRQLGDLPCVQLLRHCPKDIRQGNCLVTQADRYLANLV